MKQAIDSTMIEQILDLATNLAEENGYEYMPHALFNSEDRMYIDKAIGRLQERGVVPIAKEEESYMDGFGEVA